MKISKIKISKLYNSYSYNFDLTKAEGDICIFTGPNGYGKTTVLQIIDSLSKIDLLFFYTITFDFISIIFDNNDELVVKTDNERKDIISDKKDTSDFPSFIEFEYKIHKAKTINQLKFSLTDFFKFLPRSFFKNTNLSIIDEISIDILREYLNNNIELYEKYAAENGQEQLLFLFRRINVFFIPAQRLFYINQEEFSQYHYRLEKQKKSSIEKMVNSLQELLEKARLDYLLVTQKHDNNFIHKLLSSRNGYSEKEYNDKAAVLKKHIEEIHSFNMIDSIKILPYAQEHKNILSTYLDDWEEKLASYDQIIKKLRLFSEIVNAKQFTNKNLVFSPQNGLSIITTPGKHIDINKLSSGEKNELIMLYHFIFDVKDSSILLIDEPEISLHVAWQLQFLEDIEKITKVKNIQIILATHSPQIINNNWMNCFDFYKYEGK